MLRNRFQVGLHVKDWLLGFSLRFSRKQKYTEVFFPILLFPFVVESCWLKIFISKYYLSGMLIIKSRSWLTFQ